MYISSSVLYYFCYNETQNLRGDDLVTLENGGEEDIEIATQLAITIIAGASQFMLYPSLVSELSNNVRIYCVPVAEFLYSPDPMHSFYLYQLPQSSPIQALTNRDAWILLGCLISHYGDIELFIPLIDRNIRPIN